MLNRQGRPSSAGQAGTNNAHPTFTGNKALAQVEPLLFDVSPRDPVVFTIVAGTLVVVAAVASWVPARRASKVDANVALRAE